jgi:hypothetical protein
MPVLSQKKKGRPLAYFSKALSVKHLGLFIYEKKYMVVLMIIERWWQGKLASITTKTPTLYEQVNETCEGDVQF